MDKRRLLTDEQHKFLVRIQKGKTAKEVAQKLNMKFGLNLSAQQIKTYRGNHKLNSGLDGRFTKGHTSPTKGMKFPDRSPNSGQFKKGTKPPNYLAVGTITKNAHGYLKIKVADPNKWEFLHRREWIKHNGPIPKGYRVVFLDGNKSNCHIDNLTILKNSELARMNQNHYFAENPDLTRAGIGVVKIKNKLQELKNDHNH
ncbi:HNH endonuclease [Streptococcus pluranimalium]